MNILIGSSAIKHFFPDFPREPKDVDYIGEGKSTQGVEYLSNPIFKDYPHDVMLPNDIYTLKASHLFWDINWNKHIFDIQWLKAKGCLINVPLFYRLYDHWNTIHSTNTRSDLKMTATDFFDNAVKCPVDHDYLHTLISYIPTYTKVLKDGEEVEVSEEKFNLLSHEEKLSLVREEIYVMAYERLNNRHYASAYIWMIKKFIISHAPIWEAIFIIENYTELSKPQFNYVQQLNSKIYGVKTNQ